MQHVLRTMWYEGISSAIKFDRVEIALILALFFWLNHSTDEGEEKTGVPGENPWRRASENATYYSLKIQAPSETCFVLEEPSASEKHVYLLDSPPPSPSLSLSAVALVAG